MASANTRKLDRLRWELRHRRQRERLLARRGRRKRERERHRRHHRRRRSSPGRARSLLVPSRRGGSLNASPARVDTGVDDTGDEFEGWDIPDSFVDGAATGPSAAAAAQPGAGSLSDSHVVSHSSSSLTAGACRGAGGESPSLDTVIVPRQPSVGAVGEADVDRSHSEHPLPEAPVATSAAARPGPWAGRSARSRGPPGRSSPLVPSAEALAAAVSAAAVTAPAPPATAEFPSRLPNKTHDVRGSASPPAAPALRPSPSAFSGGVAQEGHGGAASAAGSGAVPDAAYPVLLVSGGGGAFLHPTNMGVERISVGTPPPPTPRRAPPPLKALPPPSATAAL